jgi:acyl-CoA thioesterase-1
MPPPFHPPAPRATLAAAAGTDRLRRRFLFRLASLPLLGAGALLSLTAPAASGQTAVASAAPLALVLGDSLSAEYGLRRGSGWVALLAERLTTRKPAWSVFNASISGETTAGGQTRLPALLAEHRPRLLVIELGGNDALRGLDLVATARNLEAMVTAGQVAGARVILLGMRMPPNYGRRYGEQFEQMYRDIARRRQCALVPFLLEGIGERLELFQPDRIHPTEAAQPLILANVWPALLPLLGRG